jgi:hypothetical protein
MSSLVVLRKAVDEPNILMMLHSSIRCRGHWVAGASESRFLSLASSLDNVLRPSDAGG